MRAIQRRRTSVQPLALQPSAAAWPGVVIGPSWRTADRYGRVLLDLQSHRVFLDGSEVVLRPREYALLAFFTEHPDVLVTRETIMAAVWDANWFGSTKTLDTHVHAPRHKLGTAVTIQAVRGVGFRLTVAPAPAVHHARS